MSGTTVVVRYGLGNIGSVLNMFQKIGASAVASDDPAELLDATRIVLPGVGAFDHGMKKLRESGVIPVLEQVRARGVPILGICLGMQLMTRGSEEGSSAGLGWFSATTRRLPQGADGQLRLPHMGWNEIQVERNHPLFVDLPTGSRFYFLHTYHVVPENPASVLATTIYGGLFCTAYAYGSVMGVQFHPERSHRFGMQLFRNFVQTDRPS